MHVLIVESDPNLGPFLKKSMETEARSAEWLADPEAAFGYAAEEHLDLVILDIGLQGPEGIDTLKILSASASEPAILVLTAHEDLQTRVQCLDAGADDCLIKPFSLIEFTARCRALLRRGSRNANPVLRHGDLELHRIHHQVIRAGSQIVLTAKKFALLEYLMLHRGESVSRTELLEHVWKSERNAGTNIVDVYINYLRRKLAGGSSSPDKHLIQTVRGTGYRIGAQSSKTKGRLRQAFAPAVSTAIPSGLASSPC